MKGRKTEFVLSHRPLFPGTLLAFCSLGGSHSFGESPKPAQQTILFSAA
jgi:hypothetical protein